MQRVGIDELFRTSQFLSVHVPTSTLAGFVGAKLVSSAHDLILINNTTIPGIIDPAALLVGLETGSVLRAYSEGRYPEPWQERLSSVATDRFVSMPAYTSWDTPAARAKGWGLTVSALHALVRGDAIPHRLI